MWGEKPNKQKPNKAYIILYHSKATGLLGYLSNYSKHFFPFSFFFFSKKTCAKKALDKMNFFTLVYSNFIMCYILLC